MKRSIKLFAFSLALLILSISLASCSGGMKNDAFAPNKEQAGADGYENLYGNVISPKPEADGDALPENGFRENPFIATAENPVSTFSADVDTASYSYFRKLVNQNYALRDVMNSGTSFRTEEFINYFKYDAAQPADGELFGVTSEIVNCPWNANTVLMRLTLQAETAVESTGNNLVFLIDVSGSMGSSDKLPLLKRSFSNLVGHLTENDVISIVTYSGKEEVVLDGCAGNQSERIMNAINSLKASGSTNGEAGLEKAYQLAEIHRIEGGNNRIIMASDGDLNVGISSLSELTNYITQKREAGVYLSVLGFGTGNYRDSKMEALADNGNGVYYYIDGDSEAEKVLGLDLLSTLYTVAKDVKLQLTFEPQYVASYRLIGYENRILNEEDFRDDTKDAGEVGAGHQVTVCYELTLAEGARASTEPWMNLGVVYKLPTESASLPPNNYSIGASSLNAEPSADMEFIACLIQTTMILHNSQYLQEMTLGAVLEQLQALDLTDHHDRAEFRSLIERLI